MKATIDGRMRGQPRLLVIRSLGCRVFAQETGSCVAADYQRVC